MNEYKQIKVKKDVWDTLNRVAKDISKLDNGRCVTIAGLVTELAEAYDRQFIEEVAKGNKVSWMLSGIPVILNSDSAKHFQELVNSDPVNCVLRVNEFIREEAMKERFARVIGNE